jgi:hypothetical protein
LTEQNLFFIIERLFKEIFLLPNKFVFISCFPVSLAALGLAGGEFTDLISLAKLNLD